MSTTKHTEELSNITGMKARDLAEVAAAFLSSLHEQQNQAAGSKRFRQRSGVDCFSHAILGHYDLYFMIAFSHRCFRSQQEIQ